MDNRNLSIYDTTHIVYEIITFSYFLSLKKNQLVLCCEPSFKQNNWKAGGIWTCSKLQNSYQTKLWKNWFWNGLLLLKQAKIFSLFSKHILLWCLSSNISYGENSNSISIHEGNTSSMKITDGCLDIATMNSVRTSFSPSPTYWAQVNHGMKS